VSARVFGAAVCGPDHERDNAPCEDACEFAVSAEGVTALCVCDGAGSVSHAALGARKVAEAVVASLCELRPASPEALTEALRAACRRGREALLFEARERELSPEQLACTLVAVATFGNVAAVAHIGDGAVIGRVRETGELRLLSAPDRGEFANETWFITCDSWAERLRVGLHEDIEALCALSDGCQSASLVGDQAPFPPFWSPLFDFAGEVTDVAEACAEVARLLDGEPLRRSSSDDKTLAVAFLGS
jgi:hypothetical protein